MLKIELKHAKN